MGASGTTQSVTQQNIDPAIRSRHLSLFDDAQDFINQTPFQPFPGQAVAGQQPFQQAAQALLSQGLLGQTLGFQAPQQFGPFTRDGFTFSEPGNFDPPIAPPPRDPGGPTDDTDENDDLGNENNDPDVGPGGPGNRPINFTMASVAAPNIPGGDTITRPADPFDPTITGTGQGGVGSTVGNFAFNPMAPGAAETQAASGIAGQVGMFQPQQVGGFGFSGSRINELSNPFQQQVIDQNTNDILRAADIMRERTTGSAGASTFGGDRQAIAEAEQDRNTLDTIARQSAQLRSQGFDRAAGLVGQEQQLGQRSALANQQAGLQGGGLNLAGANALNQFGQTGFNNLLSGASALNQFGTQNQANAQDIINAEMNQFNDARNSPLRDIGLLQSLLTGVPVGFNQTQSNPNNRGAGFAGGALTGAGIGAGFGPIGAGIGAFGGGLLGLL